MTIAPARISVAASFVAISLLGAGFLFSYWASESISEATGRSILFIIIMASVHLAGYLLYVEQSLPRALKRSRCRERHLSFRRSIGRPSRTQ
jgi:hypothetical protein